MINELVKELIRRVFLPLPLGEGAGGVRPYVASLLGPYVVRVVGLFLLSSCSPIDVAPGADAYCPVRFTLGGITAESSATRAAEQLADGATVRVVAYKRSGSTASLTVANYLAECTYRVTGGGTTLTPCAVNSDGTANTGAAAPKELAVLEGTYDFYAITPALAVNHTGNQPTVSVSHGADFAVSQSSATVALGVAPVTLNMLERRCAQLRFRTDRTGTGLSSLTVEKLTLTAMATAPKTVTGTGAPAANTGSVQVDVPGSAFTGSGYSYNARTVVLPKSSAAFTLKATVKFNGSATTATFEEPVAATALEAGKSYSFVLKFNGYGMVVERAETWEDIAKGDDGFGWPFFNLNAEGKFANCYIVTGTENVGATKEYSFSSTVRGNGYESTSDPCVSTINYSTLPSLTDGKSARVLWQTDAAVGAANGVIKSVKLNADKGMIVFTLGSATEGNAVIGLFDGVNGTGTCLWSWHIWKLPSKPLDIDCVKTPSPASASSSFMMMDRNLGAYNNTPGDPGSIGLLYQWGRKDPFPGAGAWSGTEPSNIYGTYINASGATGTWTGPYSVQAVGTNATYGTEAWAVKHPTVFITGGDWYNNYRNDCLWGTPWEPTGNVGSYNGRQGKKSIYDPCPIGYRVPPQDTWSKATEGPWNNGISIVGVAPATFWFPAAGFRNSGSLTKVSSIGHYWSSSPFGNGKQEVGTFSFAFVSGALLLPVRGYNDRSSGCPVRCVSESVSEP